MVDCCNSDFNLKIVNTFIHIKLYLVYYLIRLQIKQFSYR